MDLTEKQWLAVEPHFPKAERSEPGPKGGRPWRDPRDVLNAVLWILRTGAPWADLPGRYPPYQTCHRRFQQWVALGVWERMWERVLQYYDEVEGLEWTWQSADSSLHKAPLGGEKNRAQPHRPGEERHQAPRPHGGRRRSHRAHHHRRQHPRQVGTD